MKSPDPKRRQQSFQLQQYLIRAPTKRIRQGFPFAVSNGLPEPPWLLLLPPRAPHFIRSHPFTRGGQHGIHSSKGQELKHHLRRDTDGEFTSYASSSPVCRKPVGLFKAL
jgi:hypothetical protein